MERCAADATILSEDQTEGSEPCGTANVSERTAAVIAGVYEMSAALIGYQVSGLQMCAHRTAPAARLSWCCTRLAFNLRNASSAAHAQSTDRLQSDLLDVLNEPEDTAAPAKSVGQLMPWQLRRLQEAAAVGRRKIKINALSHELQIPRADLLGLLKADSSSADRATASDAQQPAQASALQTSSASQQSQARPAEGRESTGAAPQRDALLKRDSAKRDSLPVKKKARSPPIPFAQRQQQSRDYDRKRLSKSVEATLETIYEKTHHPSDEMLDGVVDLHKGMPRRTVVDWFVSRRQSDGPARRAGARR